MEGHGGLISKPSMLFLFRLGSFVFLFTISIFFYLLYREYIE